MIYIREHSCFEGIQTGVFRDEVTWYLELTFKFSNALAKKKKEIQMVLSAQMQQNVNNQKIYMKDIYVNSFNAFENFQSKKLEGKKT